MIRIQFYITHSHGTARTGQLAEKEIGGLKYIGLKASKSFFCRTAKRTLNINRGARRARVSEPRRRGTTEREAPPRGGEYDTLLSTI